MAVKYTPEGLLIYLALGACLLAFLAWVGRWRSLAGGLYALASLAGAGSIGLHWARAGTPPFRNLYGVFVVLGTLMPLVSASCRRLLRAGMHAGDMLIAAAFFFAAGFVFDAEPRVLPPALRSALFTPHVLCYMAAYAVLMKAAVQAVGLVVRGGAAGATDARRREEAIYRLVCVGFPLLTAGLILGAWWGKRAWGDFWHWDPKELWSLASWLVYVAYFHHRALSRRRHPRVGAALVAAGGVAIVITLLWVNLARRFAGLHSYAT